MAPPGVLHAAQRQTAAATDALRLLERVRVNDASLRRAATAIGLSAAQFKAFLTSIKGRHTLARAPAVDMLAKPRPQGRIDVVRARSLPAPARGLAAVVPGTTDETVTVGVSSNGLYLWVVRRKKTARQVARVPGPSAHTPAPATRPPATRPPPTPAPLQTFAPPPTLPPPTPTPTPAPRARNPYERFIVGDFVFAGKVYNEFSPGNSDPHSVRAAVEFPLFGLPWMLEGDYRSYSYPHDSGITAGGANPCNAPAFVFNPNIGDQGCVTVIGAYGQTAVPPFTARDTDFDGRLGVKIAEPRIYVGVGYLHREENYGYPQQNGFGFGAEKLPDLENTLSVYGSVWYYPSISGNFTLPPGAPPALVGTTDKFQQRFLKYQIGGTLNLGKSGLFMDGGFLGDSIRGKHLSPSDASHAGGYIGLGIKF